VKLQKRVECSGIAIEIYGGFGEIGGNCIVVREGDRKLVFDYGIRYSVIRRFYGGRIEPLGPAEMIRLDIIPNPTLTEDASALYISHLHLDHVGLLSTVHTSTAIVFPDREAAKITIGAWYERSSRWLSYVPPRFWNSTLSAKPLIQDENSVIAIPVSHSAYPATSYLYIGNSATIFYSGDLRVQPLVQLYPLLEESFEKIGIDSIDVAVIEGTNIGNPISPVTKTGFEDIVKNSVETFSGVIISVDPHDFESLLYIYTIAEENNRDIVIASERIFWMLKIISETNPKYIDRIYTALELPRPPPIITNSISLTEEVFKNLRNYIIIAEPVHLLELLRKLKVQGKEVDLTNTIALLLDTEPREAVKEVENKVLMQWLRIFGVQPQRLRISGHYQPHQLKQIIQALKPKQLIPIHTEEPQLMLKLFEKYRS